MFKYYGILFRWTRHVGHCWRSRDKLISWHTPVDALIWTKAELSARTCIQQLCADRGCSLEDLPEVMDNREEWRERVREIISKIIYQQLTRSCYILSGGRREKTLRNIVGEWFIMRLMTWLLHLDVQLKKKRRLKLFHISMMNVSITFLSISISSRIVQKVLSFTQKK